MTATRDAGGERPQVPGGRVAPGARRSMLAAGAAMVAAPAVLRAQPSLRVGYVADLTSAGAVLAQATGAYARHGAAVELAAPYRTGPASMDDLLAGRVDVVTVAAAFFFALERGADVVAVAMYNGNAAVPLPTWQPVVVGRAEAGLREGDAGSLRGARIAHSIYLADAQFAWNALSAAGLGYLDARWQVVLGAPLVSVLDRGEADALVLWPPFEVPALARPGRVAVARATPRTGVANWGVHAMLRQTAEARGDALRAYLSARAQADRYQRDDPVGAARMLVDAGFTRLPPALVGAALRERAASLDPRLSRHSLDALDAAQRFLRASARIRGDHPLAARMDARAIDAVQARSPELFSDLPVVPAAMRPG